MRYDSTQKRFVNITKDEKLFSDAKRYILSARRMDKNGKIVEFLRYDFNGTLSEAAKFMADIVLREVGEGDGENGGKGNLSNCYGEIYSAFNFDGHYEYADCSFSLCPVMNIKDFVV